jgi:hypothetical protein
MMKFLPQNDPSNYIKVISLEAAADDSVFVRINGVVVFRFDGLDGVCTLWKDRLLNEGINLVVEE